MNRDKHMRDRAANAVEDEQMRKAIKKAVERLSGNKQKAIKEIPHWDAWREQGKRIREHTVKHLDFYLGQLADNVTKAGGHVHFCIEGHSAVDTVKKICNDHGAKLVVKSKSMVGEEIHITKQIEKEGIECVETDLAEYIIQLADEPPSHIVVPAIHKNRYQIADLFSDVAGHRIEPETPALTGFARKVLREKFLKADVGITGCNFAIAETGSISLVTNEGNGRLTNTVPKVHIAIMGMERIVPTLADFESLISLLPRSATGQKLTSYVSITTGSKRPNEIDGAEEFHLIILDNGRSNLLKDEEFRQALNCTRCGACYNVCPVYRHIGGHAYGSVYGGPIGSVLSPMLGDDLDYWGELSYASTLCGSCSSVCSVKIPLHDLLISLRHRRAKAGHTKTSENVGFKAWRAFFENSKRFQFAIKSASLLQAPFVEDGYIKKGPGPIAEWTASRYFPAAPKKTFRVLWNERRKK